MMISCNYHDGQGTDTTLTSREKKYALEQLPSIGSYCSYMFNMQSSVIGPSFEFKDFNNYLNNKGDYSKLTHFSNYPRAFLRYLQGLACFGVATVFGVYFPASNFLTAEFGETNFGWKLVHLYMTMHSITWVYFAAFSCMEANMIACGFGYSRNKDKEGKETEEFNSVRAIKITPIILGCSFEDYGTNWNVQIHLWLKYYVMLRLMDRKAPRGAPQLRATFLTFVVSSLWHGTYPGFLMFFVAIALLEMQGKGFPKLKVMAAINSSVPGFVITAMAWLWNALSMAYYGLAFYYLKTADCITMYTNFHFFLHILFPIVTAIAIYMPKQRKPDRKSVV